MVKDTTNEPMPDLSSKSNHSTDVPLSRSTFVFASIAVLNTCNWGYDIGSSAHIGVLVQDSFGLTDVQRELFTGSLHVFACVGSLGSQWFSDKYGRRAAFIASSFVLANGLLITAGATTCSMLIFGRSLVGAGIGLGTMVECIYVAEIVPSSHRGGFMSWTMIGTNLGLLIGYSTPYLLSGLSMDDQWRSMCLLGLVLPGILIVLAYAVLPESPRWLVLDRRHKDAEAVLRMIYPPEYNYKLMITDIERDIAMDRLSYDAVGWCALLSSSSPATRLQLMIAFVVLLAEVGTGNAVLQYYLVDVLMCMDVDFQNLGSGYLVIVALIKTGGNVFAGPLLDRRGRRFGIFLSLIGMIIGLLLLSLALATPEVPYLAPVALTVYFSTYSLGLNTAAWLIPSEIFPTVLRAKALALLAFIQNMGLAIMISTTLSAKTVLTWSGYFLCLACVGIQCLGWLYVYLPETSNRSLESMSLYFAEITGDDSILKVERELREAEAKLPTARKPIPNDGGDDAGTDTANTARVV